MGETIENIICYILFEVLLRKCKNSSLSVYLIEISHVRAVICMVNQVKY